jgi:DNA-binding beta-propeller fold protein YncE
LLAGSAVVALALPLVLFAPLSISGAGAATSGPDPTLVVASVPDAVNTASGNVVQEFQTSTGNRVGAVGGTPVGTSPFAMAITPNGTTAYVANSESGTVTPVTVSTDTTQTNLCLPVGSCPADTATQPEAIAINPAGTAAYVANSGENSLSQILITGGVAKVTNTPITSNSFDVPDAIAITPDGGTAWVANFGNGTVVPVSIPSGTVGTPVDVGDGPTAMAITPDGTHLIVADSEDGTVTDINLSQSPLAPDVFALEPLSSDSVAPQAVAISPDGSTAYVTDTEPGNNYIVPVAIATDTPGSPVSVQGTYPDSITIAPGGATAYVADQLSDQVSVMALSSNVPSFTTTISTNGAPDALAVTPDQAPTAAFSITPGSAGSPTSFDASASTSTPSGGALTYTWDFGDGSPLFVTTSPTTTYVYANPGIYPVTLTVTDSLGTSTTQIFTGQTMTANGGPSATSTQQLSIQQSAAGASPEAIVAGLGNASAFPVELGSGPPPSAAVGLGTGVGSAPSAVAITPNGQVAYVVDSASNKVTPIDVATGQAESSSQWITVGAEPDAIAITPSGTTAYVVNSGSTTVTKIVLETEATSTIPINAAAGADLDAIAISPSGTMAYVVDAKNNTVTPINLVTGIAGNPISGSGLADPDAIAVSPNGTAAYVVDGGSAVHAGGISSFSLSGSTATPVTTVGIGSVGDHPDAIAVNPSGLTGEVVDAPTDGDTASVAPLTFSGTNLTSITGHSTVPVPSARDLYGIAVTPSGTAAYATGTATAVGVPGDFVVPLAVASTTVTPATLVSLSTAPSGIAIVPDQAPIAELSVASPVLAGAPVTFDASASSFPSSPIVEYSFDFGDGSAVVNTASPTTTHTYSVGGIYTASVTLTDQAGTSTTEVFTGQTVSRNGSGQAETSQTVTVTPTVTGINPTSGTSGTKVTISGTGFSTTSGATIVDFGANPATGVTCTSTTTCTATAPAGSPGPVDVTMTVGGQTSATGPSDLFTYNSAPLPTVSSVNPTSGPAGTKVTLTGTLFSKTAGATVFDFGPGNPATGVSCSSTTSCTATVPAGSGVVTVTVTVASQTSATGPQFTYSSAPLPTVTKVSPSTAAAGSRVTLTGTGFSRTSGATVFDFGSGNPATTVSCVSTTSCTATVPAGSGVVTITVTVASQTSATGPQFTYGGGGINNGFSSRGPR